MYKGFALLSVLFLLLQSTAFGDIGQVQGFSIVSNNVGSVSAETAGAVTGFTTTPVSTVQLASDEINNTTCMQMSNSSLYQAAVTVGYHGDYGFVQNALVSGQQGQSSGIGNLPGTQDQNFGVLLSQDTSASGTLGATVAAQSFIGSGGQIITTPNGSSVNFVAMGVDSSVGVLVSRSLSFSRLGF